MKVRSMFIAPKGYNLIAMDLAQAESWVVAFLANEPTMKDALLNRRDIHSLTASVFAYPNSRCQHEWLKQPDDSRVCSICSCVIDYSTRYIGKKNNHANSYRQSPNQLVLSVNAESDEPPYITITLAQAKEYNKRWHELYFCIKGWWSKIESDLNSYNRTLTTPYGRKRTFYALWGPELFKEATAYIPQSTVGDHALGATHPDLGITGGILGISRLPIVSSYCRLIQSAHDSILIECPIGMEKEVIPQIHQQFQRPLIVNDEMFTIPVDVEYGERWGELEKVPKEWLT
jgi:hypothetical protein